MRPRHEAAIVAIALTLLTALRVLSCAHWPDDWDGIGFVRSIVHFDLAQFTPHPPGYPVYVALLRVAAIAIHDPVNAANAIAILCGVVTSGASYVAARRAFDWQRGVAIAIAISILPLVWRADSAIGSEAPALMFASLVALGLTLDGTSRIALVGVAIGFGLGVRVSWAPFFLPAICFVPRGRRLRVLFVAAVAVLAWLAPFAIIVGPSRLLGFVHTQAEGHWTRWGGTQITEPGAMRFAYLARDLFVDGLGIDADPLGLFLAFVIARLFFEAIRERRPSREQLRVFAIAFVPYAVWILVGQNLHAQPRHALPLVALIAIAFALAAFTSKRAFLAASLAASLIMIRTIQDTRDRLAFAPAGAQLVTTIDALPDRTNVAIFGSASVRFFEIDRERDTRVFPAATLGDVTLTLGRISNSPARVFVTNELDGLEHETRALTKFATLCRPARLDRRAPCLDVYEWRAHP